MLDRFQLSEKYQFFKVVRTVPKVAISNCLREASVGKTGHALDQDIRVEKKIGKKSFYASFIVFRVEQPPTFLSKGKERDVKHCYALIIEYGDYLVVTRTGGKNFQECLDDYVEKVNSDMLNRAFMETKSTVKKANTQNTSPSTTAMHKVTYEGNNIEAVMPVHQISGKMLNSFKHETNGELFTVTGNQAKVNISNSKVAVQQYLARILISIENFSKKRKPNPFLSNFAKSLSFKQYSTKLTPVEILLLTSELRDYVESKDDSLPELVYKVGKVERRIKFSFQTFLHSFENSYEINKYGTGTGRQFFINNTLDVGLELEVTASGYKLNSEKFKKLWIKYDNGDSENLQTLINRKNWFSVSFKNADINYSKGQLWQDSKLLGSIDGFLEMFKPEPAMNAITSEKGTITATSTGFQAGSTFAYVEATMGPILDHLLLEDLNYEYSDYIGVKNMAHVQLIHCKASDNVFSATAFQEIVGQVLKNLYFFAHPEQMGDRKAYWSGMYSTSNIDRNRTGKKNFLQDLKATMNATNSIKEVHLIVNFISKQLLTDNLKKVVTRQNAPKATLPILWLLNALRNTCLERNVRVFITCKP